MKLLLHMRMNRKWAKSTLVLMPLFGVHYTVYCVMHGVEGMTEGVELVLLFCDQLFTSFQVGNVPADYNEYISLGCNFFISSLDCL